MKENTFQCLLDPDRAESAFKLLFLFSRDESCLEEQDEFDSALADILRGVKLPHGALEKLRRIYEAVTTSSFHLQDVISEVTRDFFGQTEALLAIVSLLLRVVEDEGMISRRHSADLRQVILAFNMTVEDFETFSEEEQHLISSVMGGEGLSHWGSSFRELSRHFDTLGCVPTASDKEIRKAYRDLAKKHHPDSNSGLKNSRESANRFQNIQAAYEAIARVRGTLK